MKYCVPLVGYIFLYTFTHAQIPGSSADTPGKEMAWNASNNIKHKFFLSLNAGPEMPGGNNNTLYGAANADFHTEINGKYFLFRHLALMAKGGIDIAGPYGNNEAEYKGRYTFNQYLGGICFMANFRHSKTQFNFISLYGLVTSANPEYAYDGSSLVTGPGSGFGYYEGIEFTHMIKRVGINFGLGIISSGIVYKNFYEVTCYDFLSPNYPNYSVTQSGQATIHAIILELYFGIDFRL